MRTDAITLERPVPFVPTTSERFDILCAMERYALAALQPDPDAVMRERLAAAADMDRIIARVAARACEEMTKL